MGVALDSNQNIRATNQYNFDEEEWDGDYHPIVDDAPIEPTPTRKLRHGPHPPCEPLQDFIEEELARNKGGRGVKKLAKKKAFGAMKHLG